MLLCLSAACFLWLCQTIRAQRASLAHLRRGRIVSEEIQAAKDSLQTLRRQAEEAVQLRVQNAELDRLRREIALANEKGIELPPELQPEADKLRSEIQELRGENQRLAGAPEMLEAGQIVTANELAQIGRAFGGYVELNDGRLPESFSELESCTPSAVFPTLHTNKYEILAAGKLDEIREPANTPLLRSKFPDAQNLRAYLFADGHLEMKREE